MATSTKFKQNKRDEVLQFLTDILTENNEEVMRVGSNEIAFPTVLENGDEETIVVKVSIPTGTKGRDGEREPYDPYTANKDYMDKVESKKIKEEQRREEREKKKERDRKLREEKKRMREEREKKEEEGGN